MLAAPSVGGVPYTFLVRLGTWAGGVLFAGVLFAVAVTAVTATGAYLFDRRRDSSGRSNDADDVPTGLSSPIVRPPGAWAARGAARVPATKVGPA